MEVFISNIGDSLLPQLYYVILQVFLSLFFLRSENWKVVEATLNSKRRKTPNSTIEQQMGIVFIRFVFIRFGINKISSISSYWNCVKIVKYDQYSYLIQQSGMLHSFFTFTDALLRAEKSLGSKSW